MIFDAIFNTDLRRKISEADSLLEGRIALLKDALSNPQLDSKLRNELERKVNRLRMRLETSAHKLKNGGV